MGNVCSQGQRLSICVCHAAVLLLVAQLHFTVKPTNWCQAGLQRGEKGMKSAEYHFLFGEGLLTLGKPSPNSMAKTAGTLSRNVRNVKSLICVVTPLESLNLIYWFDVINQFRKQRGESEQSTVARNCRQVSQGQFSWGLEWWCWKKKNSAVFGSFYNFSKNMYPSQSCISLHARTTKPPISMCLFSVSRFIFRERRDVTTWLVHSATQTSVTAVVSAIDT